MNIYNDATIYSQKYIYIWYYLIMEYWFEYKNGNERERIIIQSYIYMKGNIVKGLRSESPRTLYIYLHPITSRHEIFTFLIAWINIPFSTTLGIHLLTLIDRLSQPVWIYIYMYINKWIYIMYNIFIIFSNNKYTQIYF